MKEKIAAALKTKYQRFGLSNEAIDRIASAKEKTVTSEDAIEEGVADAETMGLIANELMKMRDKEISSKTDLQRAFDSYKEKNPAPAQTQPDPAKAEPKNDDEPEWAKKLREQQERISARFEREDREKAEKATRDALTARLKMEGCTNNGIVKFVMTGYSPVENESEDDAVRRLKDAYAVAYKETFGEGAVPGLGGEPFYDAKSATTHKNDFLRQQGLLPRKEQ
jgi:hypothetical protein